MSAPRRRTVREQSLPWVKSSLPARWSRVNHLAASQGRAAGIPVAGGACSRAVSAGSCPVTPKHATAVPPADTRPATGDAGMPRNAIGPPPTANNAARSNHGAIAAIGASVRPQLRRRRHHLPSCPIHSPPPIHLTCRRRPARASAQPRFRKNPRACPAIAQAATSCSFPPPVPLSSTFVPAIAARRCDGSDSAKSDSSSDALAAPARYVPVIVGPRSTFQGCRHVLRRHDVEPYRVIAPKDREEGAGGPDAPVPRFLPRQWARGREAPHGRLAPW